MEKISQSGGKIILHAKSLLPAKQRFHFFKTNAGVRSGSPHNREAVTTGLNLRARVDDIDTDWADVYSVALRIN